MDVLIYSICLGVGLLFTLISAFTADVFGGGHDADAHLGTNGHAEAGFDHSGMPGISSFSPTIIASFITAFGGLGIIFTRIEALRRPLISAPLAALGALGIAALVFLLFQKVFSKTQSSSESRVGTLIGLIATVISPIPENGVGEIAYVQAGTRYTAPARAESGTAIAAGQAVTITRIVGSQFHVQSVTQTKPQVSV